MRPLLIVLLVAPACAITKVQTGGSVAAEGRVFVQPPKYAGQSYGNEVGLVADPRLTVDVEDGRHTLVAEPFYRLDPADDRRSHADVRQADYRLSLRGWKLGIGTGIFSWGVLESYRPTDVINQTDFVERVDGSAKLGQPYAAVGWANDLVSITAWYLPYFRTRTYQGLRGRPRAAALVDVAHPEFETKLKAWQPSGAVRVAIHKRGVDFGVGLFTGLSREPQFVLELTSLEVAPRYETMQRAFSDLQWSKKGLTLKAEGFFCIYSERRVLFGGGGAGLDYTFSSFVKDADLSLALEVLFDTRRDTAPLTFFRHNVFGGVRLALNDKGNTEITVGAVVDFIDGTTWGRFGASYRIGANWQLAATANVFFGTQGTIPGAFNKDHYGELRVAYLF